MERLEEIVKMKLLTPVLISSVVFSACASHKQRRPDFGDDSHVQFPEKRLPLRMEEPSGRDTFEELWEWQKERPNRGGRKSD